MSSARYPDVDSSGRSDRTVRMLVVAGTAVLIGTVAGGFSVFAIVSALNGTPRQEVRADVSNTTQAALADGPIIRTAPAPAAPLATAADVSLATATTPPAQTELTPSAPSQPAPSAQAAPQGQTQGVASAQPPEAWPDALSSRAAHHRAQVDGSRLNQSGSGTVHPGQTGQPKQAPSPWNYSAGGHPADAQATNSAEPGAEQARRAGHRRPLSADQRASRQVQTPATSVPQRRAVVPPGRSPAYAERYDRRGERDLEEARDHWSGPDRWGERDEWNERGRWGGGFFGRDNRRDDSYE